jgi:hypothetical protein
MSIAIGLISVNLAIPGSNLPDYIEKGRKKRKNRYQPLPLFGFKRILNWTQILNKGLVIALWRWGMGGGLDPIKHFGFFFENKVGGEFRAD